MTIEITVLLSVISVSAAIFFGLKSNRRAEKTEDRKDIVDLTTVVVKLETIGSGISDIKTDMRNVRADINDTRERVIICEQSSKQAHKRIDQLERGYAIPRRVASEGETG